MDIAKHPEFRETRRKVTEEQPLRLLPGGVNGEPDQMCAIANVAYQMSIHEKGEEQGRAREVMLVLISPLTPLGLFYKMDSRECRVMGETLIRMADAAPGPQPEPELREKRDG